MMRKKGDDEEPCYSTVCKRGRVYIHYTASVHTHNHIPAAPDVYAAIHVHVVVQHQEPTVPVMMFSVSVCVCAGVSYNVQCV